MTGHAEHERILAKIAKEALLPLGLKRRGSSRTYLSDEGIWACIVEFQPSGSSKGSYLNVAAHWLWTTEKHISLDYGGRLGSFITFQNPAQFEEEAHRLASSAASAVQELRQTFRSMQDIARVLVKLENAARNRGGWGAYHAAIASALANDVVSARSLLLSIAHGNASQA